MDLYEDSDCFIILSFVKSFLNLLGEDMASGLPCVVSKICGNTDSIYENVETVFDPMDFGSCVKLFKVNSFDCVILKVNRYE